MRLFVYEENEVSVSKLANECGVTPTKYINRVIEMLNQECHKEMAEDIYDKVKESNRGRKG
jgi:hypothetical protein